MATSFEELEKIWGNQAAQQAPEAAPQVSEPDPNAPDRVTIFPQAQSARVDAIRERRAKGLFGDTIQEAERIKGQQSSYVETAVSQGIPRELAVKQYEETQKAYVPTKERASVKDVEFTASPTALSPKGRNILGQTIEIGKEIQDALTKEWRQNHRNAVPPKDIQENIRITSEGMAEIIREDPSATAILRDAYMGVKLVADIPMVAASAVYNSGSLLRYAADTVNNLATRGETKYSKSGKEVLQALTKTYVSIHDGIVPDALSNARVTQSIFKQMYKGKDGTGLELPESVANRMVDINRESAGAGARLAQFFASSIGINGALTLARKLGGRSATRQMQKYYESTWSAKHAAETGTKAVPLKSLDKAAFGKFVDDFVEDTSGVGFRFQGESNFAVAPALRDITRLVTGPTRLGKPIKRAQIRESLYQQEAARTGEVARRVGRAANLNPIAARVAILKQQDKKVNALYQQQNAAYASGNYQQARALHERIATAEARRFGYKTGLVTPATQNMVLSEVGAYVGFETAREFNEDLAFLFILGGAFMGPQAIPYTLEKVREYAGRTFLKNARRGGTFNEIFKKYDPQDVERFFAGKSAAKFYFTAEDGTRKFASKQQKALLTSLRNSLDRTNMSDQVATRMARLGELQDKLKELNVSEEQFKLTIDKITGLTPLIALRETTKAKRSLTNVFGALRRDELVSQVEIVKLEADALMSLKNTLDEILPDSIPNEMLPDIVNDFKRAATLLVEDRYRLIRADLTRVKGLLATLEKKDRSIPALVRGEPSDQPLYTQLTELENKLTRMLKQVDEQVGAKSDERLIPALDEAQAADAAIDAAAAESRQAAEVVVGHNFRRETAGNPMDRLVDLAEQFLDTIGSNFSYRFDQFFNKVEGVNSDANKVAEKLYDIMDADINKAELFAGVTPKAQHLNSLRGVIEDAYKQPMMEWAAKKGFDLETIQQQVAQVGGYYKYYQAVSGKYDDVPAVQISVRDMDLIRRGLNDMRGKINPKQSAAYKELGESIDNDINTALNKFDLEQKGLTGVTIKKPTAEKGTAKEFAELRDEYFKEYMRRKDTRIGELISGTPKKKEVRDYNVKDWDFLRLDRSVVDRDAANDVFAELSKFFGRNVDDTSGAEGVRRDLNPETKFEGLHTRDADGNAAVSDFEVGPRLSAILNDMQKESLEKLKIFKGARTDEGDLGTIARRAGTEPSDTAINLQEARLSESFNGLIDSLSDGVATSLKDLARKNKGLSDKIAGMKSNFSAIKDEFADQFETYKQISRAIDQSLASQIQGVKSIDELVDALLRPGSTEINNIRKLVDEMADRIDGYSKEAIEDVFRDAVSKVIKKRVLSGGQVMGPEGTPQQVFDYDAFSQILRDSKQNLEVIFDTKHVDDMIGIADIMSVILTKIDAPAGVGTYQIKTLSPSSVMSRIYAVSRGVVSFRYVASEAALLIYGRNKQDELIAMMNDPVLADMFFKVLTSRRPLPANETKPEAFLRALARASAYDEAQGEE